MRRAVVLAVVMLLGLGVAGYFWITDRTLDHVSISAGFPRCEGAEVKADGTILAEAGMQCVVDVEIRNDGGRTIEVLTATFPFLGARGGGVVKAGHREGFPTLSRDVEEVVNIDDTLAGGDSLVFRLPLRFRASGCNGGGTLTVPMTAHVSWLGREQSTLASGTLRFTQAKRAPGCRDV